jgi:hypothetical protein
MPYYYYSIIIYLLESNKSIYRFSITNDTKKLIDVAKHLLTKSKELTEQNKEQQEKNANLMGSNLNLGHMLGNFFDFTYTNSPKIESKASKLEKRETDMDNLICQIEILETDCSEKEMQQIQITRKSMKDNRLKELEEQRKKIGHNLGGYTVNSNETPSIKPAVNHRRQTTYHSTFSSAFGKQINHNSPTKDSINSELVESLIKVVQNILKAVKDQSEITQFQDNVIENVDKDVERLQRKQYDIIQDEILMKQRIESNAIDSEEHWKCTQQVIEDHNELQNEIEMLKKVDLASLKHQLMQMSTAFMTEKSTLGKPSQSKNDFGKYQVPRMEVEQSLFSLDYHYNQEEHGDNDSDDGLIIKNSVLDNSVSDNAENIV